MQIFISEAILMILRLWIYKELLIFDFINPNLLHKGVELLTPSKIFITTSLK